MLLSVRSSVTTAVACFKVLQALRTERNDKY